MAQMPPHADMMFEAITQGKNDPAAVMQRLEMLEFVLERSFTIPGINRAVGLDAIIGLVPVILSRRQSAAIWCGKLAIWACPNGNSPA
jgi:hypothetical protein